jgi:DNA-directed RNA polymerase specialized sigma24 family protein
MSWMPLLNSPWQLRDVADVEALLRTAISRSRHTGNLRPHELDDLVAFLFEVAWRADETYKPGRGSFSSFLYAAAQRRIVDFHRSRYRTRWRFAGKVHERPRPELLSVDDEHGSRLVDAVAARAGDRASDRLEDGGGVFAERDRCRASDLELLGLEADR